MKVDGRRCFNGHRVEHAGCAGCHHAYHVVQVGRVAGGRLVPPTVSGSNECALCHRARHVSAVAGCPYCEPRFEESVKMAMEASKPVRTEVWGLRFLHWFIGWQATLAGWLAILAGANLMDWFRRSDGSFGWLETLFYMGAIPVIQALIRRTIARRERLLPSLGPRGEIVYGHDRGEPPDG